MMDPEFTALQVYGRLAWDGHMHSLAIYSFGRPLSNWSDKPWCNIVFLASPFGGKKMEDSGRTRQGGWIADLPKELCAHQCQ